jgi:hypothetical protein
MSAFILVRILKLLIKTGSRGRCRYVACSKKGIRMPARPREG